GGVARVVGDDLPADQEASLERRLDAHDTIGDAGLVPHSSSRPRRDPSRAATAHGEGAPSDTGMPTRARASSTAALAAAVTASSLRSTSWGGQCVATYPVS